MGFDIIKIRNDFPILNQEINSNPLIYFDNAATTQKPKAVIDSIQHYYLHDNANIHRGVHTLSSRSTLKFEAVREKIRQHINAPTSQEIIFVRGTTEAINLVAQSYGPTFLKAGDVVLVSQMEHHANIVPWQMLAKQINIKIEMIPITPTGEINLQIYQDLLAQKPKLVALTHISNALGTINPIEIMIQQAKQVGARVLIDGAQALPHVMVDVQKLDCDFYVFSGHKMYGPTGIGILYGKEALLTEMPPWQGGGDMIKYVSFDKTLYNELPYKFEAGTPNIAGVIGLGAAIDYINQISLADIQQYEQKLLNHATELLSQIQGLQIIGTASDKAAILTFIIEGIHAHDIGTVLDHHGIAIRTGHHCAMPAMDYFKVSATARASFSFYNKHEEIERLAEAILALKNMFA